MMTDGAMEEMLAFVFSKQKDLLKKEINSKYLP